MNLGKLFSPSYLFNVSPGDFKFMALFIAFFLVLLVGSFYLEGWIKKHPRRQSLTHLLPNIGGRLRMFGLIGFIFLWIRYENLPYLSMRALLLAFLLYVAWVIGNSIYKVRTRLGETLVVHSKHKERNKYLPRKKKKSKKRR